jgi:hypothetical protein
MSKIYVILVAYCMKLTRLSASKGSNYYKHVEKTYNFRIKSETGKPAKTTLTWLRIWQKYNNKWLPIGQRQIYVKGTPDSCEERI